MTGARMGIFSHSPQESSMFSPVQVRLSAAASCFSVLARKSEPQTAAGYRSLGGQVKFGADGAHKERLLLVLLCLINKRVLRKYFEPPSVTKTCHISFNLLPWKLCLPQI